MQRLYIVTPLTKQIFLSAGYLRNGVMDGRGKFIYLFNFTQKIHTELTA